MNEILKDIAFFRRYAMHLNTSAFPALTRSRRSKKTTDREILMLGDSHGWGQGCPDFDARVWYSPHMPLPTNKGFYARVSTYLQQKLELFATPFLPDVIAENMKLISGVCKQFDIPVVTPVAATGYYAGQDQAVAHLGYLALKDKFNNSVYALSSVRRGKEPTSFRLSITTPVRSVYLGVLNGKHGGKLKITLTVPFYYVQPPGYPKVYRIEEGEKVEVLAEISGLSVVIDTYGAIFKDNVYCIDFGQKQEGTLTFAYAGCCADAIPLKGFEQPAVLLRGAIFDANQIRNFSLGGHTVGQWVGDGTRSFHDASYDHLDEILSFVPFTPLLVIIQAPVVNEYLQQTPIAVYIENLEKVIHKVSRHCNKNEEMRTDFLLFTTLPDQTIQYGDQPSAPITYSDYFQATKQFCMDHQYGFIDFAHYFNDAVESGHLTHDLLYDDAIHPSPFANEFIARGLQSALDMLM